MLASVCYAFASFRSRTLYLRAFPAFLDAVWKMFMDFARFSGGGGRAGIFFPCTVCDKCEMCISIAELLFARTLRELCLLSSSDLKLESTCEPRCKMVA